MRPSSEVAGEERITIELNPRERRLYDRMRTQLVKQELGAASGFRDMLLLLPDLTVCLMRLMRDDRVPLGAKALAMVGVGYVLTPIDLIPSLVLGPIGWVDDLLVVSATLSRLMNHVHPDVVRSHWPGQGDALEAIQRATRWSERLLGDRIRGVFSRLNPFSR